MYNRYIKRTSRRRYVREQLTGYGVQFTFEIPYQTILSIHGYRTRLPGKHRHKQLKIIRQFAHFLMQKNGMDSLEPTEVTLRHIRHYLTYLKNESRKNISLLLTNRTN